MRINTNLSAMTALNSSTKNTALASNSMEKLSSGLRINKAADDAAGLAISEKMRSQIRGLDQAAKNTQDGISVVQTAEGATEEVGNIVQRMRELSVQSANETNSASDRSKIVEELTQLHEEIDRIATSTQFNGKDLLNGSDVISSKMTSNITNENYSIKGLENIEGLTEADITFTTAKRAESTGSAADGGTNLTITAGGKTFTLETNDGTAIGSDTLIKGTYTLNDGAGNEIELTINEDMTAAASGNIGATKKSDVLGKEVSLQVGANTAGSQQLTVKLQNIDTKSLGLDNTVISDMKNEGEVGTTAAKTMIDNLDKALEKINTSRANLGATQNRLETTSSNLTTSSENLTAAESRIRDVDVAAEMMNLSKLNLLTQASQAMMSQAKSQPEGVMDLLR